MHSSKIFDDLSKKRYQNDYYVNEESNESHEKLDFGRCKVCKDKATGIHYGIPSCEGCKGFYKRSVGFKHQKYVCYFGSKCPITPRQRRCKLCRWKKCVEVGMSFDAIKMGRISKSHKEKVKSIIEYDIPKDAISNTKKSNENRILNPDQMKLAKEIRKKCLPAYIDYSSDIVDTYQRAINCINNNKPEPINPEIFDQKTFQYIWPKFLNRVDESTKQLVLYIQSLPGLCQLDVNDLSTLFDKHATRLLRLRSSRSYIGGELFIMIKENVRLTRGIMARLMGDTIQEKIFKFHERFKNLGLNDREMSFLMPTIMTYSIDVPDLKHPNQVAEIHEVYKQALIEEFNSNNRSEEFIHELVEIINQESPFSRNEKFPE